MEKRKPSNRGFVTALSTVLSVVILTFFAGIYYIIQTSTRENLVIDLRDQSSNVSEAAIQEIINIIRANPDLEQLDDNMTNPDDGTPLSDTLADGDPYPMPSGFYDIYHPQYPKQLIDSNSKLLGRYFSKVRAVNVDNVATWNNGTTGIFKDESNSLVAGEVFHIVTEGWALDKLGRPQSRATSHAFVHLANVGDYFCAVRGELTINPGSKLKSAKVYGRNLKFFNQDPLNPSELKEANYDVEFEPDPWPDDPINPLYGSVLINNSPTQRPIALQSPLTFPSINEQINFYAETIPPAEWANNWPTNCTFMNGTLQPPSVMNAGGIMPTGNAAPGSNRDHAYFCPDEVAGFTIGNIWVEGQVILASSGPVRINGPIRISGVPPLPDVVPPPPSTSEMNYTPPDTSCTNCFPLPQGIPSTADQLVIYAPKGVIIEGNWCGIDENLQLHGLLIISPESTIKYESTDCEDFDDYSLDFMGAMFLADQPTLGGKFVAGRNYRYLETLKTDPPPVREFYQVLKQFTLRRGTPQVVPSP